MQSSCALCVNNVAAVHNPLLILAKKHLHTTSEMHILIAQKLFSDSKLYDYVTSSDLVHCFECYITEIMLISKTLLIMVTVHWAVYSGGSTWGPGGPVPPSPRILPPTFASVTSCIICYTRIRCSYVRMTCIMHSETCIVSCN